MTGAPLTRDSLVLDAERAVDEIVTSLRESVHGRLRRRGAVLGLSGGIDSSVCVALCARAFGPEKVLGVLMPEADSASDTLELSGIVADHFEVDRVLEDISGILEAAGCYSRRDEAFRSAVPAYGDGWKAKIVLPSLLGGDSYRLFSVVAESPTGERVQERLSASAYRQVVAATNFKQRTRKMLEYYHADRLNYAASGTPNLLEYDQGFFVKLGDGAADIKPIAHLYKSQVYAMAAELGLPDEIQGRSPTTDTFSLPQSQEEFYFALPYQQMDQCLWAFDHDWTPEQTAGAIGLTADQVARVYRDIQAKRRVAQYLHHAPRPLPDDPGS